MVVTQFNVLASHFPEGTGENHETPRSVISVPRLRFKQGTSETQVRHVTLETSCSILRAAGRLMNRKGCDRKRSRPNLRYYPNFCLMRLRIPRKLSVKMAGFRTDIWTSDLPSTKRECFPLHGDDRSKLRSKKGFCGRQNVRGSGCTAPRPARFNPGERAYSVYWVGGWVLPRTGLDDMENRKILPLPGLELRPLGHPADCAIPVAFGRTYM
jgi:hypothetical protein